MAVRWAYGASLTLCVALAVLLHHETSMTSVTSVTSVTSMTSMTSMTSASPMSTSFPVPAPAHAAHAMAKTAHVMEGDAASSASESSTHGVDSGACAMSGMQHCTTASVVSVQLAVPGQSALDPPADPELAAAGRAPASAVGRAPPDLSVLSQLRI
ncbi:hypothetical protein FGD71_004380 [Streptomyces sporangiiformans]|uniref:Uncharacterized protein n=2 Tax=Streptomyces sporangiiformans TaxID=2315329 RepID=A0A505DQL4_9ACTN|nr:hypothetical protein FGD71_004380 [Streptomyces sporangiiformans]